MKFEDLISKLRDIPYPSKELKLITPEILGQGFFPAAKGFVGGKSPDGGVMLLGQDWGTELQFEQWRGIANQDETAITSRNIRECYLSSLNDIPAWCTNYLLGARKSPIPATGDLEDYVADKNEWASYEAACWRFFHLQVQFQRPSIIVLFGEPNRRRLSGQKRLGMSWGTVSSAAAAVKFCAEESLQHSVRFDLPDGTSHKTFVTYAYHPCYGQGTAKKAMIHADAERVAALAADLAQHL